MIARIQTLPESSLCYADRFIDVIEALGHSRDIADEICTRFDSGSDAMHKLASWERYHRLPAIHPIARLARFMALTNPRDIRAQREYAQAMEVAARLIAKEAAELRSRKPRLRNINGQWVPT